MNKLTATLLSTCMLLAATGAMAADDMTKSLSVNNVFL